MRLWNRLARLILTIAIAGNCNLTLASAQDQTGTSAAQSPAKNVVQDGAPGRAAVEKEVEWTNLIDAKHKDLWKVAEFGGEGKVEFKDSEVIINAGYPLSGITYSGEFPKENFEVVVEANRLEGSDFMMGLTFPVGKGFCSYIAGGWGGGVVGISSIDGMDASENSTTTYEDFKNDTWYKFRVRVDEKSITGWINEEEVFQHDREGHRFTTRAEVELTEPFGMSTFESKVAVRKMQFRKLPPTAPDTKQTTNSK